MRFHWPLLLPLAACLCIGCRPVDEAPPALQVDTISTNSLQAILADATSARLIERGAEGQLLPGLAQSWRISDDGLSIVLRLRTPQDTNIKALNSKDVATSLESARQGQAGHLLQAQLAGIAKINTPLPEVVELQLTTPQPEMLEFLASPQLAIRPRGSQISPGPYRLMAAGAEATEPKATPNTASNTAPAAPEQVIRLQKNPAFYGASQVALAQIHLRQLDSASAVARFDQGLSDLLLGGWLDGLQAARAVAKGTQLQIEHPRATFILEVNATKGPLAKADIRRAIQMAINRPRLAEVLFETQAAIPTYSLSPQGIEGYSPPVPDWANAPYAVRQQKARDLLLNAAPDVVENPIELTLAIPDTAADARLAALLTQDLAAIGINLRLAARPMRAHMAAIQGRDFDLALMLRTTAYHSPLPFLLPHLCQQNRLGICNPQADQLLEESWKAPTRADRMTILARAEQLWADEAATIGLVQAIGWSLVSDRVSGISANTSGSHALRHLSVNPERTLIR